MRDWLSAFLPASFRGVPFKVDIETLAGARRLAVSPIAYGETSVIEDMGREQGTFQLTAYTAGDMADLQSLALVPALDVRGAGMLVLPMGGPRLVRVTGWSISRYKTQAGLVAIDISFMEEGLAAIPFLAGAASGRLGALLTAAATALGAGLSAAIAAIAPGKRGEAAAAATAAAATATSVSALAFQGLETPSVHASALDGLDETAAGAVDAPADFALALCEAWRLTAQHAGAGEVFDFAIAELSAARADTPVRPAERAAMLGALSIAAVRRAYQTRSDAAAARARLAELATPVLAELSASFGADAFAALAGLTGEAALDISRSAADRAPLVRVESGVSLPATVLAHALYGDATRAGEIVTRNRVATPCMMPVAFEAAAQ